MQHFARLVSMLVLTQVASAQATDALPWIEITPNPAYELFFGNVRQGLDTRMFIGVTNTGDGTLTGQAVLTKLDNHAPFGLVGDATFVLEPGESDTIVVRFGQGGSFPWPGDYVASLQITHNAGEPIQIGLRGTIVQIHEYKGWFGCGRAGEDASTAGDLVAIAFAVLVLLQGKRMRKFQ